jgi:hypothetical protein
MAVEPKFGLGTQRLDELAVEVRFVLPRDDVYSAVGVACEDPRERFVGAEGLGIE